MSTKEIVRSIVAEVLKQRDDTEPFADDEPLAENGRLDSMDIVDIIFAVEDKFGLDFGGDDFDPRSLPTIDKIVAHVELTQAAADN